MKARGFWVVVTGAAIVSFSTVAWGAPWQQWRGSGGWGMGGAYQRMYDPAKVETVSGEVVGVDKVSSGKGRQNGIHLRLKTDKETLPVHLGPSWYIERLDTKIVQGDRVEVKGARATVAGKPALIAAEVRKGDGVLQLRDEKGIPVWAGWRK